MKHPLKSIAILLLISSILPVIAQSMPFDFTITSSSVSVDGSSIGTTSMLQRTGNSLVWGQSKGEVSRTEHFVINATMGDWNLATSTGTLVLKMSHEGTLVDLVLTGSTSGKTLSLIVKIGTTREDVYTFSVKTIHYQ